MKQNYKRDGYPSVSVYILVSEAQRVIDFVAAVFDAKPLLRKIRDDGSIWHVEMRIDDSVIMIADTPKGGPTANAWLHVYVPDVDETYRRALAAGGISVQEPAQKADEDRRGGVKDPAGNTWWIATQVSK